MNTTLLGPSPFFLGYNHHRKYEFLELLNEIKKYILHHQASSEAASSTWMTTTKYGDSSILFLILDDDNALTKTMKKKNDNIKIIFIIDLLSIQMNNNIICVQWNLSQGFRLTFQNRSLSSLQSFHLFNNNYSTINMNTFITIPTTSLNEIAGFYLFISIYDSSSSLLISDSSSSSISLLPSLSRRESLCSSISSISTYNYNVDNEYDDGKYYEDDDDDNNYQGNEALLNLIQDTLQYIHSSKIYSNELKTIGTKLDDLSSNYPFLMLE